MSELSRSRLLTCPPIPPFATARFPSSGQIANFLWHQSPVLRSDCNRLDVTAVFSFRETNGNALEMNRENEHLLSERLGLRYQPPPSPLQVRDTGMRVERIPPSLSLLFSPEIASKRDRDRPDAGFPFFSGRPSSSPLASVSILCPLKTQVGQLNFSFMRLLFGAFGGDWFPSSGTCGLGFFSWGLSWSVRFFFPLVFGLSFFGVLSGAAIWSLLTPFPVFAVLTFSSARSRWGRSGPLPFPPPVFPAPRKLVCTPLVRHPAVAYTLRSPPAACTWRTSPVEALSSNSAALAFFS